MKVGGIGEVGINGLETVVNVDGSIMRPGIDIKFGLASNDSAPSSQGLKFVVISYW